MCFNCLFRQGQKTASSKAKICGRRCTFLHKLCLLKNFKKDSVVKTYTKASNLKATN